MRNKEDEVPLFKDRKEYDVIDKKYFSTFREAAKEKDIGNDNEVLNYNDINNDHNDIPSQEHNLLNIITIPHNIYFILFISLLIGLSISTLLSFVFPLYSKSSFQDQIPDVLSIHGFKVGPAFFDGKVYQDGDEKSVNIEISSGLNIDLGDEFSISTANSEIFKSSDNSPVFMNMETDEVESKVLKITDDTLNFSAQNLIINNTFQVMGTINAKKVIYNGCTYGDTKQTASEGNFHSIKLKSFFEHLKNSDDFGHVNDFSINYPYVAVADNSEMRIYKYENENQFFLGSVKGNGKLHKNLSSNSFIFDSNSYRVVNDGIEKADNAYQKIDFENETVDKDGNRIFVSYNKTGAYFVQCDGFNCRDNKSILLTGGKNGKIPLDLKISFDQFESPVITSNSLKTIFLVDADNDAFEQVNINFDDVNKIDNIKMLSYTDQLLFLTNHTLMRYLI